MAEAFIRPDVRQFLQGLASLPGPRLHELDPPAARVVYASARDLTDLQIGELAVRREFEVPGPAGLLSATLFDAREHRAPGPLVLFFHGGGFVIGTVATHAGICAEMARALDLPVVSLEYRLAPENPWPAAPDDCEAAARWLAGSHAVLGRTVTALALAGDSAGGNLAIVTAAALRDRPAAAPVLAQLAFYPATDTSRPYPSLTTFGDGYLLDRAGLLWFDAAYAAEREHIRASPLLGELAGLPPAVVVTASLDPIRDQGRAYAAALAQAGVSVIFREAAGMIHGFVTLRRALPSAVDDVAGALAAFRSLIAEIEAQRSTQTK